MEKAETAADGSIANPANGSGGPAPLKLGNVRSETLLDRLPAASVEALQWQVRLWRAMLPLRDITYVDSVEQGILRGLVFPMLINGVYHMGTGGGGPPAPRRR